MIFYCPLWSVVIIFLTRNIEPFILNWSSSDTTGYHRIAPLLQPREQIGFLRQHIVVELLNFPPWLWLRLNLICSWSSWKGNSSAHNTGWELIVLLYEFSFVYHQIIRSSDHLDQSDPIRRCKATIRVEWRHLSRWGGEQGGCVVSIVFLNVIRWEGVLWCVRHRNNHGHWSS